MTASPQLIEAHRTTLIFVNTRRMAERVTRQLSERLGEEHVTAHHGSLAKEQRLDAEQRLKRGELKALVATASLELGIDIGEVDLVCQLGSPRSIASFLQRVGRSGHAVDGTPKGRLFPLSRDELVECAALLDSVRPRRARPADDPGAAARRAGAADRRRGRGAGMERGRALRADPPRLALSRAGARGFRRRRHACWPRASPRGAAGAARSIHHDAVNHMLRGRRGARLTALTSGGTIPDTADYQVLLEPENQFIGTVNEDFAVESLAGDVFQLGNTAYRIMRVERGVVRVEDAQGMAPTIPFWLGEAPGRSDELSHVGVAAARGHRGASARRSERARARLRWLMDDVGVAEPAARAARRISRRGACARSACLPTQDTHRASSASSTRPAACSSSSIRPMAAASTAPGAWRCASASAASSISSCRRRRPRTTSSCR